LHALPAVGQGDEGRVKQAISSPQAPNPAGAYSPAVRAGDLLFMSGQIPIDPATGQLVQGDAAVHARRAMDNLGALLSAAGLTFAHVVRTTVFLADMNDFAAVNEVYASYFTEPRPARVTVQAARLPRDARLEIDAIASFSI
jgi:2-iminobutanoate/2-iminopropanoate deaminase